MCTIIRSKLFFSINSKVLVKVLFGPLTNKFVTTSKLYNIKRFKHSYITGVQFTPPGSRYVPPDSSETTEEFILSSLKHKTAMSYEEWEDFKSELMDHEQHVSEENFSSIVMNTLLCLNMLELSHNFLKYVEESNVKPNFLTYLKYISLCSNNLKIIKQDHILKIIDKVRDEVDSFPILDNRSAEYMIQGLCATNRWRESLKYLDKLISKKPTSNICTFLACAAIRNEDMILAWEILHKWIGTYDTVDDKIIHAFLEVALKVQNINGFESDRLIEKVFQYMQVRDIIISIDVAKLIEQYFKSHHVRWSVRYTKLSRHAVCDNCEKQLQLFTLKNNDFNDLCQAFLERAVMKSDLYINTTSKEFDRYMDFIEMHKPFHIVLDGLNAAYSLQGFNSKKNLSMHLCRIVRKLAGNSRKLLVLGRKHMKSWPGIHKLAEKSSLFFTDNISQDDPFTIYATLASGPHTLFLSGDLMRDHLSRLGDSRLMHLFKRWQLSHQMFIKTNEYNEVSFVEPVRHSITVHGAMKSGWHIPFDDKIILDPYEELNNWLCIQKCI